MYGYDGEYMRIPKMTGIVMMIMIVMSNVFGIQTGRARGRTAAGKEHARCRTPAGIEPAKQSKKVDGMKSCDLYYDTNETKNQTQPAKNKKKTNECIIAGHFTGPIHL